MPSELYPEAADGEIDKSAVYRNMSRLSQVRGTKTASDVSTLLSIGGKTYERSIAMSLTQCPARRIGVGRQAMARGFILNAGNFDR